MAKQTERNLLFRLSATLAPVLLVLLAVAVWFGQPATAPAGSDPLPGVLAAQLDATINGNERALNQFLGRARGAVLTDRTREAVRTVTSNEERLRSFIGASDRLEAALASIEDRLAGASDSSGTLPALRMGAEGLGTWLAALRGNPGAAVEYTTSMTNTAAEMSAVVNALSGAASDLDIAPLADSATAGLLAEQMIIVRGATDILAADLSAFQRIAEARDQLAIAVVASEAASSRAVSPLTTLLAPFWPWLPLGLILATVLCFLVMALSARQHANLRDVAQEQADQNERNQQAILRLLDELGSLADGDLTVEATVTEDITGAIADSINYAIEALRELVTTIDGTAALVDDSTKQTEQTAVHMNRAAQKQAREIAAATESISAIAASIEEVSGNAERSADVARHSVDVAHKGGDAVRRTIEGMNTIRETIQETSKRIKRLGESSQEIGNIVELINDIAEQTNILALNASIQASMAGEAGRGFAVVADEVQRLAERSTNATKQIEVLVRTIQADTNEAVVSMERSTTDVVGGALLAENAGAALDEIEQVSNQIASLVQNIYASARGQSQAAGDITQRTSSLKQISVQTSKATNVTTASIGKLAQLAGELRKSVSGFRLPDSANVTRFTQQIDPDAAVQQPVVEREAI
ncbi:MAG: methyl-accepting chemotaxis protein [Pseudomonadota bacterium]